MPEGETPEEDRGGGRARGRLRLGAAGVRRLRIGVVSGLVLLVVLAGAGALWLSVEKSDPRPPAPARASGEPPLRLDRLPPPARSRERSAADSRRRRAREERSAQRSGEGRGSGREGSGGQDPSRADIRRELAALARENARVEALLGGDLRRGAGTGELVRPAHGGLKARFGRPWGFLHAGIDIAVPAGTPVHAADAGRVVISETMGGYGRFICLQHTGTLSTCYAHNSRLLADEGESVDSGDVIARSGCSGRCYADHLHFEVRVRGEPVNPRDYL